MRLYRQKDSKVWWIDIASNGQRVRKSTFTKDKKLAEAILAKVRTEIVEGKWFGVDQSKIRTLRELMEKYLTERSVHKSLASYQRDKSCFGHLNSFFGDCTLASITPSRINEYKQKRLQVGPSDCCESTRRFEECFQCCDQGMGMVQGKPSVTSVDARL